MASEGPYFVNNAVSSGIDQAWTNPANILSDNGALASVTTPPESVSAYLLGNFEGASTFAIPSGATIDGIIIEIDDAVVGSGVTCEAWPAKAGPTPAGLSQGVFANTGWQPLGSSTDLWSDTWTPAQINSVDFGAMIKVTRPLFGTPALVSIDAVRITVYYTPGGQTAYADATLAAGSWTATGAATLHEAIDEPTTPTDTDYISTVAT